MKQTASPDHPLGTVSYLTHLQVRLTKLAILLGDMVAMTAALGLSWLACAWLVTGSSGNTAAWLSEQDHQRFVAWAQLGAFRRRCALALRRTERLALHGALHRLFRPVAHQNACRAGPGLLRRRRLRLGWYALLKPTLYEPSYGTIFARRTRRGGAG